MILVSTLYHSRNGVDNPVMPGRCPVSDDGSLHQQYQRGVRTIDRNQMVEKLNALRQLQKSCVSYIDRERYRLQADALEAALRHNIREHNEKLERGETDD